MKNNIKPIEITRGMTIKEANIKAVLAFSFKLNERLMEMAEEGLCVDWNKSDLEEYDALLTHKLSWLSYLDIAIYAMICHFLSVMKDE